MSAGAFRSKECESCGFEFGAGDIAKRPWVTGMTRISGATSTGYGTSSSTQYGSSGSISRRQGSRQATRYSSGRTVTHENALWICNGCWDAEQARRRTEFFLKVVGGGILALGVVIYLALQGGHGSKSNISTNPPPTPVSSAEAVTPPPASRPEDAVPAGGQSAPAAEKRNEEQPAEVATDAEVITPTNNATLRDNILDALEDGRSRQWKADGVYGAVSVSTEQQASGQSCRNYRYTIERPVGDGAPHDGAACRVDGGAWKLGG
ncbi:MAG: hypothetical protein JWQ97_1478, partial [Phenylobacterium sp.]|nr:hypothetical protein [Phenylobacterium sp.]